MGLVTPWQHLDAHIFNWALLIVSWRLFAFSIISFTMVAVPRDQLQAEWTIPLAAALLFFLSLRRSKSLRQVPFTHYHSLRQTYSGACITSSTPHWLPARLFLTYLLEFLYFPLAAGRRHKKQWNGTRFDLSSTRLQPNSPSLPIISLHWCKLWGVELLPIHIGFALFLKKMVTTSISVCSKGQSVCGHPPWVVHSCYTA